MSPGDFEHWLAAPPFRPLVMGVLNVTPDSFSDGGQFAAVEAAIAHARQMIDDGVDLIDIGGESTRPGAQRVDAEEQIRRVGDVIEAVARLGAAVSIDTTRSAVAAAALDSGACFVNDVSAGRDDPAMASLVATRQCPIVLMHMPGDPLTMQSLAVYEDVVAEVHDDLLARAAVFETAGVPGLKILLDPGIGFGKTHEHNLQLLRHLDRFIATGRPILMGVSRKKFVGTITNTPTPGDRVFGTAAAVAWCVAQGAAIVRVHDVAAMRQVVDVIAAIRG